MGKKNDGSEKGMTYASAGVDIKKADKLVGSIKEIVKPTFNAGVIGGIGGFGGLFRLLPYIKDMKDPVLVSSTDGVGTKLKIAFMMDKHDTVGIDLVAMCVNDLIVQGATPINFLDYLAMGELDNRVAEEIIKGIANGCIQAGCALTGGETAEMPGMYAKGEYDLAGFANGIVDSGKIIDGSKVKIGNALIGLQSSGLHSNGFSLVRKIIERYKLKVTDRVDEFNGTIGEELLTSTKIYVKAVLSLLGKVQINGIAHITGGGLTENIPRVLPNGLGALINVFDLPDMPIFYYLQKMGKIQDREMFRTFNNGIGMVLIVPKEEATEALNKLKEAGEKPRLIGEIISLESKYFLPGERVGYDWE